MLNIVLEIFGGLGLFFVGINVLSASIKQLGSSHAPSIIRKMAQNDLKSAIGGLVAGVITSSGKAVTFSLVALTELGALNLRQSLPIIMGGSIGSAFIVLWASFSFKTVVFVLMGVAGMMYQFGDMKNARTKALSAIVLGFGLLFYGLELIKHGAAPMRELPWFDAYIISTKGHWILALIIGTVLALLSQSGSSVAIIAMSLVAAGILGYDEAVMLVFGTNIGSGISTGLLGLGLNGTSRLLVMFHGFFKIVGVVVMVPLLYIEVYADVPLVKHLAAQFSENPSMQIAVIYLLYEIITGVAIAGFLTPIAYLFERSLIQNAFLKPGVFELETLSSKLRVAVLYGDQQKYHDIKTILERGNISVVNLRSNDPDWRNRLDEKNPDVLLVNMDEQLETHFDMMEALIEDVKIPVAFNDSATSHDHQHDWGDKLVRKLFILANREPQALRSAA